MQNIVLCQKWKPDIFDEISPTMGDSVASYSLKGLSEFLADYYGKKVIILLDEYDTPMQEAYVYGEGNHDRYYKDKQRVYFFRLKPRERIRHYGFAYEGETVLIG